MVTFKYKIINEKGQSLMEILFAMSIAVVAISSIAYVLFGVQVAARQSIENVEANALIQQAIGAVKSISERSFDDFESGVYGLSFDDNTWGFIADEDTTGKFTRTITVTEVTNDLYMLLVTVSWDVSDARATNMSAETYISNWRQNSGDATDIQFDTSSITYQSSGFELNGVTIENTHQSDPHTITDLKISWDGTQELDTITIDSGVVYTASTSGKVASGSSIDIDDVVVSASSGEISFGPILFDGDMQNTDIHIAAYFADGSVRYSRVIP